MLCKTCSSFFTKIAFSQKKIRRDQNSRNTEAHMVVSEFLTESIGAISFLQQQSSSLPAGSCLHECFRRGACVNGACQCYNGWGGDFCQDSELVASPSLTTHFSRLLLLLSSLTFNPRSLLRPHERYLNFPINFFAQRGLGVLKTVEVTASVTRQTTSLVFVIVGFLANHVVEVSELVKTKTLQINLEYDEFVDACLQ
jgi:hypothetical protein